jgi:hypothetical protein
MDDDRFGMFIFKWMMNIWPRKKGLETSINKKNHDGVLAQK